METSNGSPVQFRNPLAMCYRRWWTQNLEPPSEAPAPRAPARLNGVGTQAARSGRAMSEPSGGGRAWTITILLTVFMLINFLDKIALGLVAVPLMDELHLSPKQ